MSLLLVACGGGGAAERDGGAEKAGPDAAPPPACSDETSTGSALLLDGNDDHVAMGVAPELGLETFTIEAWVRREGEGQTAGTGAGGLRLVPIAAKGRGENDDTIYNCNYAFGFRGNVLGADFEDSESGANHPVVGTVAIPRGEWHHVAATYDGDTWRLYVDGFLDTQRAIGATPRGDSIQHFAIGAMMNSEGVPAGAFEGTVDEVRVWNRARTGEEIAGEMYRTLTSAEGLVGRWGLDEGDGGAPDSAGSSDGTVVGGRFLAPGMVLDQGSPPAVIAASPADDALLTGSTSELEAAILDPDDDQFEVRFHLRELSDQDDFTVVVLPDTQHYTRPTRDLAEHFYDQTEWVTANRESYNIVAVIHNGDIVHNADDLAQWMVADTAMSTLEAPVEELLPDGIPYGVCVGNHDQDPLGTVDSTDNFNQYFGVDRFAGRAYYGGNYSGDNDENWFTFSVGGLDFVVVNLQFNRTPDPAVLGWARSVFEAHPDAFGILNSHYIVGRGGGYSAQGQAIYDTLRDVGNVQLMTSGHISAEARRTDVYQGNVIHSMLADYQSEIFDGEDRGGSGFMRIWEFSPRNDELTVRSYSPSLDRWLTDGDSEFTLKVELPGAGGPFQPAILVDPAPASVSAMLEQLTPGATYEWYVTASDCAHTAQSDVRRFTVPQ